MINVIGLGYIGLPTALMFAAHGVSVTGTDVNKELVATLNSGQTTFDEDGMQNLLIEAMTKNITFTSEYISTNTYIVTVPTPYDKFTKKINPCFVIDAVKEIIRICDEETSIVIESTVAPGTIDRYIRPIIESGSSKIIHLVHAPERIIPGQMIYELKNNPRTIGADDIEIGKEIKTLYSSFCIGNITVTDIRTAEMTKVIENTYRDINIAFANELMKICRIDALDVYEIIRIANMHPRVNILQPGPGVGGHCISVDPWFLVGDYPGLANIILAARKINDSMPEFVLERVYEIMKETGMKNVDKVGIYGLTYKENVDDVRESPTLQLLEEMERHLAKGLKVYDPFINKSLVPNQYFDLDTFLYDIDLVIIMVAHNEIMENMDKLVGKVVLDTKNVCFLQGTYKL